MADTNASQAISRKDTMRRLCIGETTFHKMVKEGQLRVFKIGKKTLVTEAEIQRIMAGPSDVQSTARSRAAS